MISGPPLGQSVTFVRPDQWLGGWGEQEPAAAWREIVLVRRFLRIAGVWEHERKDGRVRVTVDAFCKLTAAQEEQIEREVGRVGTFLGAPADVAYSR